MDIITGAIVGGIAYDVFKIGVSNYLDAIKFGLKDYLLTDEEKCLIAQDFENVPNDIKNSKENLISYFENSAKHTQEIVNKYQNQSTNVQHTGIGDIYQIKQEYSGIGDSVGRDKITNYYGNISQEEYEKKH